MKLYRDVRIPRRERRRLDRVFLKLLLAISLAVLVGAVLLIVWRTR